MRVISAFLLTLVTLTAFSVSAEVFRDTKVFKDFTEAQGSSEKLQFIVESTKAGLFSSDVDGYVKKYNYSAEFDERNQILRKMKITFPVNSMDTDNETRDEKLHNFCLRGKDHPYIEVTLTGPIFLKSPKEVDLEGEVKIGGKVKKYKVSVIAKLNENGFTIAGKSNWSLKEMEIQDPSILVAKLSDEIRINFTINHLLK